MLTEPSIRCCLTKTMEKYKYHTDQDHGKVSIPGTMVTWLLPDQDQGKVGWDQLRRGAHLGGRD